MNMRRDKAGEPYDVRVDRHSPLGNSFYMKNETQRAEVCDQYRIWFEDTINSWTPGEIVTKNKEVFNELWRLILLYRKYGKLRLFCWCTPKQCHAETIRDYLFSIVS